MNKLWCDRHHIHVIYSCNLQDFPLGGGIDPWGGGVPTSDAGAFQWKRVRK